MKERQEIRDKHKFILWSKFNDARQVVHLQLSFDDSRSHFTDVFSQIKGRHFLEDGLFLSLGEILDFSYKGRVLLQGRVQFVKVGLLGTVLDVQVAFSQCRLPFASLNQLWQILFDDGLQPILRSRWSSKTFSHYCYLFHWPKWLG